MNVDISLLRKHDNDSASTLFRACKVHNNYREWADGAVFCSRYWAKRNAARTSDAYDWCIEFFPKARRFLLSNLVVSVRDFSLSCPSVVGQRLSNVREQ